MWKGRPSSLQIQDLLIEKLTRLKHYLDKNNATTHTPPCTSPSAVSDTLEPVVQPSPASRLPKLDLSRFSGDPLGWQTFWDSYQAAVHSNPKLTGVEKFNYLRSLLDGKAYRNISGFTLQLRPIYFIVESKVWEEAENYKCPYEGTMESTRSFQYSL